jgi:hypothetical protein
VRRPKLLAEFAQPPNRVEKCAVLLLGLHRQQLHDRIGIVDDAMRAEA